MDKTYHTFLSESIPKKDCLNIVRTEAKKFYETHSVDECFETALELYKSDNFQIQEIGVLLCGYIASKKEESLDFLRKTVSCHTNWKVQEILAMAFDTYCKIETYEKALPIIESWITDDNPNVRRAVSEGLRIWTSRPYFDEHPEVAIKLLADCRYDESLYVRKSIGNALRDISKKFPCHVKKELLSWDLSSKPVQSVYKLAARFILEEMENNHIM